MLKIYGKQHERYGNKNTNDKKKNMINNKFLTFQIIFRIIETTGAWSPIRLNIFAIDFWPYTDGRYFRLILTKFRTYDLVKIVDFLIKGYVWESLL